MAPHERVGSEQGSGEESSQGRSTIKFPYLDLDDAVKIAKAIHAVGGQSCQRDQLAAYLAVSPTGGGFNLRLLTAKHFGFINTDKKVVSLTALGGKVCDPQQEKAARSEAFLLVPLYKAIYEQFKSNTLPPNSGLEGAMENLGVAPKQKDKARQVFQRSATQAGFFAYGSNRLVLPPIRTNPQTEDQKDAEHEAVADQDRKGKHDNGENKRHPFIEGLLDKLPPAETEWSIDGRKKWLQTAANIFDLMYSTNEKDVGELSITYLKASAK